MNNAAEVQIRIAALDEAARIAAVLRAAFSEYEAQYTPAGFAATVLSFGNAVVYDGKMVGGYCDPMQ